MPAQTALRDEWRQEFPHLAAFADAVPQSRVWQFPPGFGPFLRSFNRGMAQLFAAEVEAADFLAGIAAVGENRSWPLPAISDGLPAMTANANPI